MERQPRNYIYCRTTEARQGWTVAKSYITTNPSSGGYETQRSLQFFYFVSHTSVSGQQESRSWNISHSTLIGMASLEFRLWKDKQNPRFWRCRFDFLGQILIKNHTELQNKMDIWALVFKHQGGYKKTETMDRCSWGRRRWALSSTQARWSIYIYIGSINGIIHQEKDSKALVLYKQLFFFGSLRRY
jgi:hypothetical protein